MPPATSATTKTTSATRRPSPAPSCAYTLPSAPLTITMSFWFWWTLPEGSPRLIHSLQSRTGSFSPTGLYQAMRRHTSWAGSKKSRSAKIRSKSTPLPQRTRRKRALATMMKPMVRRRVKRLTRSVIRCSETVSSANAVAIAKVLRDDLRPDALVREDLQEDRVRRAAVDDVRLLDAPFERIQAGLDLGEHPLADRALLDHPRHVLARQRGKKLAVLVLDAPDVREDDEFLRPQRRSDGAGDQVGVDVVRAPVLADAHGGDDRDGVSGLEVLQDGRVYRLDIADEPVVPVLAPAVEVRPELLGPVGFREGLGLDEPPVLAAQADGLGSVPADQRRDLLVDGPAEDHLDDFHRGRVGHADALAELGFDGQALEHLVDLRPAAV